MANLDPFRNPEARSQLIDEYDAVMRTWPVPFDEQDVATGFGTTHRYRRGAGRDEHGVPRSFRREFLLPTKLTDDELRRVSAPKTVLLGDREVIYTGGPQAAIARAQKLIPNVHALLLPSAGHILTLDAPDVVVAEMTEALT